MTEIQLRDQRNLRGKCADLIKGDHLLVHVLTMALNVGACQPSERNFLDGTLFFGFEWCLSAIMKRDNSMQPDIVWVRLAQYDASLVSWTRECDKRRSISSLRACIVKQSLALPVISCSCPSVNQSRVILLHFHAAMLSALSTSSLRHPGERPRQIHVLISTAGK